MAHAQKRDFVFRRNGRVHFNRRGASVQSTAGSRGVRISGSNAGYTVFRGSVKSTGYPLHSPVSPSLPLPCVTVCHHISTGVYQNITQFKVELWWRNVWTSGSASCDLPLGTKRPSARLLFKVMNIKIHHYFMWQWNLVSYTKAAFLKLWSADHKWSSGSALVALLDWTLVQKKTEKIKLTWIAYHTL